jgi:hypothetical protein
MIKKALSKIALLLPPPHDVELAYSIPELHVEPVPNGRRHHQCPSNFGWLGTAHDFDQCPLNLNKISCLVALEAPIMMYEHFFYVHGYSVGPPHLLVAAALIVIPFWQIFSKAGYSGWLSLLVLLPFVNVIALYILAFSEWPATRARSSNAA